MFVFFVILAVVGFVSGNVYGPIVSKQECKADSIELTLGSDSVIFDVDLMAHQWMFLIQGIDCEGETALKLTNAVRLNPNPSDFTFSVNRSHCSFPVKDLISTNNEVVGYSYSMSLQAVPVKLDNTIAEGTVIPFNVNCFVMRAADPTTLPPTTTTPKSTTTKAKTTSTTGMPWTTTAPNQGTFDNGCMKCDCNCNCGGAELAETLLKYCNKSK